MGTGRDWGWLEGKFPPREHLEFPSPSTEHFHIFQIFSGTADNPAGAPDTTQISTISKKCWCLRVHSDLDFKSQKFLLLLITFPCLQLLDFPALAKPHLILSLLPDPQERSKKKIKIIIKKQNIAQQFFCPEEPSELQSQQSPPSVNKHFFIFSQSLSHVFPSSIPGICLASDALVSENSRSSAPGRERERLWKEFPARFPGKFPNSLGNLIWFFQDQHPGCS